MDHLIASIMAKIGPLLASSAGKLLLTQAGAGVVIAVALRIIPNSKLEAVCFGSGKALSAIANTKLGKVFWEPIENFLENSIGICMRSFFAGLDSDDDPPKP